MCDKCYCGPDYMPKFLRCLLSKKFNKDCKQHDIDYIEKKLSRREADQKFRKNMLTTANNHLGWIIVAELFNISVKLIGFISFKNSK